MEFIGVINEVSESSEVKNESSTEFSSEALDKFDKIMGDDKVISLKVEDDKQLSIEESEIKFSKLFDIGDFFKSSQDESFQNNVESLVSDNNENKQDNSEQADLSQKREVNLEYEFNGDIYETDDNGHTYKKNGELVPNTEYTVNGNKYKTDDNGNKIYCYSEPVYTEDGTRNTKEQKESGGEERKEDDDGGHIIAKILGGAEGEENLVPMRRTINRGDYKKMENEIVKALQEGKNITIHINLEYDEDSKRPSKIRSKYIIDGKKTVVEFDNKENSTELLYSLNDKISDEDYTNLKEEIEDMKVDGVDATITSIKSQYDEEGNPTKVTVGVLDEATGKKTYKVYEAR